MNLDMFLDKSLAAVSQEIHTQICEDNCGLLQECEP